MGTNYNITPSLVKLVVKVVGGIVAFFVVMAFVRPWYNVWSQEMEGKAEFAKGEQNQPYLPFLVTKHKKLVLILKQKN